MCNSQIQDSIIGIMNNLLTIVTQMYVGVQKYYKLSNGQLHKLNMIYQTVSNNSLNGQLKTSDSIHATDIYTNLMKSS